MNEIRFIDLFRGIGGFHLGLKKARGFRCVWSNDIDKYANQIYNKQFGEKGHSGDIRGVNTKEIPDFDLLCAGFPCQAFSLAGPRKGFQDTRGTLFFEICRIAKDKRPSLLLLENVKGLLNHDRGRTFTVILQSLDELGYWVEWQVLNSKYFGVPQNRERVFIIGHLRGTSGREIFPIRENEGIFNEEQSNFLPTLTATDWKGPSKSRSKIIVADKSLQKIGNIAKSGHDSLWGRVYDPEGVAMNLNAEGGGLGAKTGLYAVSNTVDTSGWLRQMGRHEIGKHGLTDYRIRRLTPIECERLQGFPDNWTEGISDTQRYKCLGNAVTVNVIEFLGHKIKESMEMDEH